jgi:hypothetical protein
VTEGEPEAKSSALAGTGIVSREGLLVNMAFVRFVDTFEGPPAAVRWLHAAGCGDFRYQFAVGYEAEADDDEAN